jgi:hypothetical protein
MCLYEPIYATVRLVCTIKGSVSLVDFSMNTNLCNIFLLAEIFDVMDAWLTVACLH